MNERGTVKRRFVVRIHRVRRQGICGVGFEEKANRMQVYKQILVHRAHAGAAVPENQTTEEAHQYICLPWNHVLWFA